jgi:hypothetical protein
VEAVGGSVVKYDSYLAPAALTEEETAVAILQRECNCQIFNFNDYFCMAVVAKTLLMHCANLFSCCRKMQLLCNS